jgi:hypothetical protein
MSTQKVNGERPKGVTLQVRTQEAYWEIVQHFGFPITPHVAGELAGVSTTRIYNMIDRGKFTKIYVFGAIQISPWEFEEWLFSRPHNKGGRPKRKKDSAPGGEESTPEQNGQQTETGCLPVTYSEPHNGA